MSTNAKHNRKPNSRPRTIRAKDPDVMPDDAPPPPVARKPVRRAKSVGKPINRADDAEQAIAFQPRAVSTESSSERNNPLRKKNVRSLLLEGAASMTLSRRYGRFRNDYSDFIQSFLEDWIATSLTTYWIINHAELKQPPFR